MSALPIPFVALLIGLLLGASWALDSCQEGAMTSDELITRARLRCQHLVPARDGSGGQRDQGHAGHDRERAEHAHASRALAQEDHA